MTRPRVVMKCPADRAALKELAWRGIRIDECPRCRGRWFDRGELKKATERADEDLRWIDFDPFLAHGPGVVRRRKRLLCPKCAFPMAAARYPKSRVTIEVCPTCRGVWLGHGEFERIIGYLSELIEREPAAEYGKDAIKQLVQIATGPQSPGAEVRDLLVVLKLMEKRIGAEHPRVIEAARRLYDIWPLKF